MMYSEFVSRAMNLTIKEDRDVEAYYLDPQWIHILHQNGLGNLEEVNDSYLTDWLDVEDMLKLEVERLNMQKKARIIKWLSDIIEQKMEPLETDAENEFVDVFTKYFGGEARD